MKRIFFLLLIAGSVQAQNVFKDVDGILDSVQPDSIKRHIAFLADDKMKGRLPGTPEFKIAVDYVIAHFKQFGMKPAGDDGTFLQNVKIRKAKVNGGQCVMEFSGLDQSLVF